MANSEDIEARLCAYIEGDLDAAQREEIERHLAAHPQHQKMIGDLILTRNLLTSLPRAVAPTDLGEGLQGQLERSMLLGDDPDEHDHWRVRARRMPRVAALAAVVLVTAGLATVIVQLLRAANHPAQIAAIPVPPPIVLSVPSTQPSTQPSAQPVMAAAVAPAATTVVGAPAATTVVGAPAATTQPVAAVVAVARPATQPAAATTVQLASFSAPPPTEPSMQMVEQPAAQPDGDDMEQSPQEWPAGDSKSNDPVADGPYPQ